MKRDQKFAFANSSTPMVRCGGAIENDDFDEVKNANVGLFWCVFVVTT